MAVYPHDLQSGTERAFLNWHRKAQLSAVARWLGRGRLPLLVEGGAQMLPMRTDYEDYTLVSVANLTSDTWDHIAITLDERECSFGEVKMVTDEGVWVKAPVDECTRKGQHLRLRLATPLDPLGLAAFLLPCAHTSKSNSTGASS